jgi:hypothetical protein
MKRRHPWAALHDLAGNVWCTLWHHPMHWTLKYPGPHASPIDQVLRRFPIWHCRRCGRAWGENDGKFTALTHRRLDAARAQERT